MQKNTYINTYTNSPITPHDPANLKSREPLLPPPSSWTSSNRLAFVLSRSLLVRIAVCSIFGDPSSTPPLTLVILLREMAVENHSQPQNGKGDGYARAGDGLIGRFGSGG